MNPEPRTENRPRILATVLYRTISKPNEREIRKTVRSYANLSWQLVNRSESEDATEYGQFSRLEFKVAR